MLLLLLWKIFYTREKWTAKYKKITRAFIQKIKWHRVVRGTEGKDVYEV